MSDLPPYEVTITYPVWQWSPEHVQEWTADFVKKAGRLCIGAAGGGSTPARPTEINIRQVRERLVA